MAQNKHDTQQSIGKILKGDFSRDAVHIAVAPMAAFEKLIPGQRVGIIKDGVAGITTKPIGVVDPYLEKIVQKGEKFWVLLFPNTITSLRHEWEHPEFDKGSGKPDKAASEKWLREYANMVNPYLSEGIEGYYEGDPEKAYQTLLSDLEQGAITYHGRDMHSYAELLDPEELQHHAQIVLGKQINFASFEYFSCSC